MASDCVLGSRHRDVATVDYQFGWLQGDRNLLRQNSFWLQRPDLNQRTWEAEPVLTRQVLSLAQPRALRRTYSIPVVLRFTFRFGLFREIAESATS